MSIWIIMSDKTAGESENEIRNGVKDDGASAMNENSLSSSVETFCDVPSLSNSDSSESPRSNRVPLISEIHEDELQASLEFVEKYRLRFGDELTPVFYVGTLGGAAMEAFNRPTADKRLLGVYLHHVESLMANIFCTELLGYHRIQEILKANFVLWGWDVTIPVNKTSFLSSCVTVLGKYAENAMNIQQENLPALVVISRLKSSTEIRRVIQSTVGLEEFIDNLTGCIREFRNLQETELRIERARASREMLKSAQDQAYKESLEIDRAKAQERKRKLEDVALEEERTRLREEERCLREREERARLEAGLSAEPPPDAGGLVTLRFRPPAGEPFQRGFLPSSRLQEVLDFLASRGYRGWRALAGWPRRDIATLGPATRIAELSLSQQEVVILRPP